MGIGSAILGWMADEAAPAARNLWVSASDFQQGCHRLLRAA
jgi:hypothetical protein